jgi:hypothetical protein
MNRELTVERNAADKVSAKAQLFALIRDVSLSCRYKTQTCIDLIRIYA